VIKAGTSNLCADLPPLRPCILQGFKSPLYPFRWGGWTVLPTRDISPNAPYTMPWTIQDGYWMRGVPGEVWVIAGGQHLKFWVP